MNTTLDNLMRATNRNLLVLVLVLLATVLLLATALRPYLISLVRGARPANNVALSKISAVNEFTPDYLTVRGEKNFDTGFEQYSTSDSGVERLEASFRLLRVSDHYLLVKSAKKNDARLKFSGTVESIPTELLSGVNQDLEKSASGLSARLYPFLLHADNAPSWWLAIAFAVLTAIMLWYVAQWTRRNLRLENHPLVAQLAPYGAFTDVQQQIDADLATPDSARFGRTRLMQDWLLRSNRYSLQAMPFQAVAWAYPKVTQHRTNGIPTGKTFSVMVYNQHGESQEFQFKKIQSEAFLEALHARAPWAIYGFNDQLKQAWDKDRAGFIAEVQQRKAQVLNPQPGQ